MIQPKADAVDKLEPNLNNGNSCNVILYVATILKLKIFDNVSLLN